jgi:ubiquinone/menaquinone biosynthesis C-methylase UbiE
MARPAKAWKGMAMEGRVAEWYARNTGKDARRFRETADLVASRVPPGGRVLEVAPGPGFLAIELARRGFEVLGVDVSRTFVEIARRNAAAAGVRAVFEQGDAAQLPLPAAAFDFAVCTAAFKNFSDPLGALDELHRVLRPGARASIIDLRRDATLAEIDAEVAKMGLSRLNAALTRWTFRAFLLRRASTRDEIEALATRSRFGGGEAAPLGIGFDLRLAKAR